MDHSTFSIGDSSVQKFLDVAYDQRWELLKPTIVHIYMQEKNKIARLAERMKGEYSFDAQVHQYRYHFKKWGIKKRITTKEKGAVISALGKRRLKDGASTSDAVLDQGGFEKAVDKTQLKRHINQTIRQSGPLTWTPGLFLRHDLPYDALSSNTSHSQSSPSNDNPATPGYLTINSPQAAASPSESRNAMSPTMQLVERKVLLDRAELLLGGREQDLMAILGEDEKRSVITWLHDFWIFSFMTTKYWGRGPKTWTRSLIESISLPRDSALSDDQSEPVGDKLILSTPTQHCRWAIHSRSRGYVEKEQHPKSNDQSGRQFDINDDSTWKKWPKSRNPQKITTVLSLPPYLATNIIPSPRSLATIISYGFHQNIFTAVQVEDIPLAADSILKTVDKFPGKLQAECLGFAIMSRNRNAISSIINDLSTSDLRKGVSSTYPFHLAAKFLDGAKTCCLVMEQLIFELRLFNSIDDNYIDNYGCTVLDTLFVTILRSHSTVSPQTLSDAFIGHARYPGQEVDPCGRWDADSPCVRHLYASGRPTIPHGWKHIFCHTSVQAICHCIFAMFFPSSRPDINTPSGLFGKQCRHCGLELKVKPLHALVLTAFYLANNGMPGETLFGMVACLVCLLTYRADPCATAEYSIPALLGYGSADECQHSAMNAAELASRIPSEIVGSWSPEIILGWKLFTAILEQDIRMRREKHAAPQFGNIAPGHALIPRFTWPCGHRIHSYEAENRREIVYCGNRQLGRIWAMIQAELLSYRRLSEQSPWLSPGFEMEMLLDGLENESLDEISVGTWNVFETLGAHSTCGHFYAMKHMSYARMEEACTGYHSNLDDRKRATFVAALDWDW
ncbi:hypothetical protein F5Y06DRAFT_304950 [Hypoxylon sp. FL0890]|nr:hypothetical protein F5Y06DRAFT_304950 [Hypoxylon sp. FL0890]